MSLLCFFGFHKWVEGKGYHEARCDVCGWHYFEEAGDSPQGRGRL